MKPGEMQVHHVRSLRVPEGKVVVWIEHGHFEVRSRANMTPQQVTEAINEWAAGGGMLRHQQAQQRDAEEFLSQFKKEKK
jgi:hypothetical protein